MFVNLIIDAFGDFESLYAYLYAWQHTRQEAVRDIIHLREKYSN